MAGAPSPGQQLDELRRLLAVVESASLRIEEADYVVTERRRGRGGVHQSWALLYYVGRGALAAHVAELQRGEANTSSGR